MTKEELARKAFEAYTEAVGGTTYDGKPIPEWEALTRTVQIGWIAAVNTALGVPALPGPQGDMPLIYDPLDNLSEGQVIHFVMPGGQHRPAIIVNVWRGSTPCEGYVNLQVFTDCGNDLQTEGTWHQSDLDQISAGLWWRTSICHDQQHKTPGTWHFPE